MSKILECHVHTAFYRYLNDNHLLHHAQSRFRHLYSYEKAIDEDLMNGVILLDLRKAFDLIDHQILLHKLSIYKCSDESIKWFKSYLIEINVLFLKERYLKNCQ